LFRDDWLIGDPNYLAILGFGWKGFGVGDEESRLGLLLLAVRFKAGSCDGLFGDAILRSNSYFDLDKKFWNELLISYGDFSLTFNLWSNSEDGSCLET